MKTNLLTILTFLWVPLSYGQIFYTQEDSLGVQEFYGNFNDEGGSGVSFSDFNLDGKDDLTFSTEDGKDVLFYENKGNYFELIEPLISNTFEGRQIIWADFDNDLDLSLIHI